MTEPTGSDTTADQTISTSSSPDNQASLESALSTAGAGPTIADLSGAGTVDAPTSHTSHGDSGEPAPTSEPEYATTWQELDLPPRLQAAVDQLGWTKPTPVQARCFRSMVAGNDVLVQSQTGSGKTGAFCLPWLASRFEAGPARDTGVQLLVLLPTRELAKQVCEELVRLATDTPVDVLPVYGGTAMSPQLDALARGIHAVVGTPGRILDHIRRRALNLSKVRTVVLDECDEMLSMGFLEDIRAILSACPNERQTCLYSATVPRDIERIARRHMRTPKRIELSGDAIAAAEISHAYYSTGSTIKTRDLLDMVLLEDPAAAIVFCNTREETRLVANVLQKAGYVAEALSSDLTQTAREKVMAKFRERKLRFLVATDVAARGIDVSHVSHVINYSFPENSEVYVHRTGRTGRAGRAGSALSLISPQEIGSFYTLTKSYKSIQFTERVFPPAEQLATVRIENKLDRISHDFAEPVSPEWVLLARNLANDPRGDRVIAYLLHAAIEDHKIPTRRELAGEEPEVDSTEELEMREYRERPPRQERGRGGFGQRDDRGGRGGRSGRDGRGERDERPSRSSFEPGRTDAAHSPPPSESDRGTESPEPRRRRDRSSREEGRRAEHGATVESGLSTENDDERRDVRVDSGPTTVEPDGDTPESADQGSDETAPRRRRRRRRRHPGGEASMGAGEAEVLADDAERTGDAEQSADDSEGEARLDAGESEPTGETASDDRPRKRRRRRRRGKRPEGAEAGDSAQTAEPDRTPEPTTASREGGRPEQDGGTAPDGAGRSRRRRKRSRSGERSAERSNDRSSDREEAPPEPTPEPRLSQDEIFIDIDEQELDMVRDEFGEIDELDELTVKGRRRAVLEELTDDMEVVDLSAQDSLAGRNEDDEEGDETEDEAEGETNEESDAADVAASGESSAEASSPTGPETEAETAAKKKRRRRRKKKAPLAMPELTAPPHKDFWEVWAARYSAADFVRESDADDSKEVDESPTRVAPRESSSSRSGSRQERSPRGFRDSRDEESRGNGESGSPAASRPETVSGLGLIDEAPDDAAMARVVLNVGRRHGYKASGVRALLTRLTGLHGKAVKDLTVRDQDTVFRMDARHLDTAQTRLDGQVVDDVALGLTVEDGESPPGLDASSLVASPLGSPTSDSFVDPPDVSVTEGD